MKGNLFQIVGQLSVVTIHAGFNPAPAAFRLHSQPNSFPLPQLQRQLNMEISEVIDSRLPAAVVDSDGQGVFRKQTAGQTAAQRH